MELTGGRAMKDRFLKVLVLATVRGEDMDWAGMPLPWMDVEAAGLVWRTARGDADRLSFQRLLRRAERATRILSDLALTAAVIDVLFDSDGHSYWWGELEEQIKEECQRLIASLASGRGKMTDDVVATALAFGRDLATLLRGLYCADPVMQARVQNFLGRAVAWCAAFCDFSAIADDMAAVIPLADRVELRRARVSLMKRLVGFLLPIARLAVHPDKEAYRKLRYPHVDLPVAPYVKFRNSAEWWLKKYSALEVTGRDKCAVKAAEVFHSNGILQKLVDLLEESRRMGRTVWFLGRDGDALFLLALELGYNNARYMHGFNREFVHCYPSTANAIARVVTRPGDVIVDTGFKGTCLEPFLQVGGRKTVLVSSCQEARDKGHLGLDEGLSERDADAVRDAVIWMEHIGELPSDSLRRNRVAIRNGVPEETWNFDSRLHCLFMRTFIRHALFLLGRAGKAADEVDG